MEMQAPTMYKKLTRYPQENGGIKLTALKQVWLGISYIKILHFRVVLEVIKIRSKRGLYKCSQVLNFIMNIIFINCYKEEIVNIRFIQ